MINNVMISLSTTAAAPQGLSQISANNIGGDNTTVFNGNPTISSANIPGPGNTRAFDVIIALTTPFLYDPSAGNWLLDIKNSDPGDNRIAFDLDAQTLTNDTVSWVQSPNPNATNGARASSGLVTQFTTRASSEIPESSSWLLLGMGIIGLGYAWRRRK